MRTITKEYTVYNYTELSPEAKEKVRQWYLNGQESYIFTDIVETDLDCLFRENDLQVQYSLASCQGDGFNIYGKIDVKTILSYMDNHTNYNNAFSENEKHELLAYQENCDYIELPYNNHYCYSLADRIDIVNNWQYDLECIYDAENIDTVLLKKFEGIVKNIFTELCNTYESWGYNYFYEIEEEELKSICMDMGYEFLEDGTIF